MLLYILDLIGTFAFAVTGAFKAKQAKLSIFGALFLGMLTAVGGGTIRDLIIGRTPLFYLNDINYLLAGAIGSLATFFVPIFFKQRFSFFRFIDSIGLAAFSIIGTSVAYNQLFGQASLISLLASVFLGMITGFGGGLLRDIVMGDTPFALRKGSNYTKSAFLGALSFYVIMFYNINIAIAVSLIITMVMREVFSGYGVYNKLKFKKQNEK